MRRKSPSDKTNDRQLLKYIQLAYEYASRVAVAPLSGSQSEFLTKLYQRRLSSVLTGVVGPDLPADAGFEPVRGWFREERAKRVSDILVGHIDQFRIGNDEPDAFRRNESQFLEGFRADLDLGRLLELGVEAYATYLPIHFFFSPGRPAAVWGVYISEQGVMRLAAILRRACYDRYGDPPAGRDGLFVEIAYQILLRHELQHFKVESFALNAELFLGKPIYVPYLTGVYAETLWTELCLEEALANATVLNSRVIEGLFKRVYSTDQLEWVPDWRYLIFEEFFQYQPPGYRDCDLRSGRLRKGRGHHGVRGWQDTMNLLCNQIVCGGVTCSGDIPFYAFPPDNFFLRAERLVPIHVVGSLSAEDSFIGVAPPKKREWESFLKKVDYYRTDRGKGDHVVWESELGWNSLTLNYHGSELDFNAFRSSLRSLGLRMVDFQYFRQTKRLPDVLVARLQESRREAYA
jgi:hypothetical protein